MRQGGTVKRFSTLVAVASAAMAMAAMFAGSASAGTVLCDQPKFPCPQSEIEPAGSTFYAGNLGVVSFEVENSLKCTSNVLTPKSTSRIGNPLPAQFSGSVDPSSCWAPIAVKEAGMCTSVTMNSPPTNIKSTGAESAVVEIGSSAQPLTVSWLCNTSLGTANCSYKAGDTVNLIVNGGSATIKAPLTKVSGNFLVCKSPANLVVNNKVTETWISTATETVFCSESVEPCSNSQILPSGTRLGTSGGFSLTPEGGGPQILGCQDSMTFDSTQASGMPLPTTMGASIFVGSCKTRSSLGCNSASWSTPASSVEGTGGNAGVVRIGSSGSPLTLSATCTWAVGTTTTCTWSAADVVSLGLDGNNSATVTNATMNLTSGSSFWCLGTKAKLTITRTYGGLNNTPLEVALI
jgi:hypothetical protein